MMISANGNSTCAMDENADLWCWGLDSAVIETAFLANSRLGSGDAKMCIPCREGQIRTQSNDRCLKADIDNCLFLTNDSTLIMPKCYQCEQG